jgi:hypothetical protein
MQLNKSQIIRVAIAVILVIASLVLLLLTSGFNHGLSPAQPSEDTNDGHTQEGKSQLIIKDDEKLKKRLGLSIANSVTGQLYAAHYQKSSKLERQAELVDLNEKSKKSSTITIKFIPSGETMTAHITVNNTTTNDFDIKIDGVSQ